MTDRPGLQRCFPGFYVLQERYMEKYDFDTVVPRRGTGSMKWDAVKRDGILPMWVADMDFRTAPAVVKAVTDRAMHGIFGYTHVPDEYYQAVIGWFGRRHGFNISKEWIIYVPGVVPALSAIIKAMTSPGEKVIIQTPVYNCFFSSIRNNGCEASHNPLVYKDVTYSIDFEDLERKASDPAATLMILCNPHNPAGRVWTREELIRIGEICLRHNVFVIADEIHCELTYPGHEYTPFASVSEEFLMHSATCTSPSKAFNTAGLQIANIVCADPDIRARIDRAVNVNEVCDVNPFGVAGLVAAYNEGGEWLEQLKAYLYDNYLYLKDFFRNELPDFPVLPLEGTYLVWADCSVLGMRSEDIERRLLLDNRLWINAGIHYGEEGDSFIRINIACPKSVLTDGLKRLASGLGAMMR